MPKPGRLHLTPLRDAIAETSELSESSMREFSCRDRCGREPDSRFARDLTAVLTGHSGVCGIESPVLVNCVSSTMLVWSV